MLPRSEDCDKARNDSCRNLLVEKDLSYNIQGVVAKAFPERKKSLPQAKRDG